MISIVIIEDEIPARKKLRRFIEESGTAYKIVAEIASVREAVEFLEGHEVDLIFSDIELLDGNALGIYRQVTVNCPIIFTTAYDQFWMEAFDENGIAYLLKPYSKERFQKAWNKFLLLRNSGGKEDRLIASLSQMISQNFENGSFKKRFTISSPSGFYFLETQKILYFEADQGLVFAHDSQGKRHMLTETTLKEIEEKLDPMQFFRINRSELIHKAYIERIERYNKNTLVIRLRERENSLKTSQSTTASFREWVEK